nr:hypothetical protein [Mycoplasmopsis bovis]
MLLANPIYSGCGAGGDPKVGKECALNSIDQIKEILADTNVLILSSRPWWWHWHWSNTCYCRCS